MVRLVLGLVTCALLLVGIYHTMKPRPVPGAATAATGEPTAPVTSGPAAARQIVDDLQKIEAANRAAMERTLNAATK